MAFNTRQHDKQINKTLKEIQSGVFDNVKALEKEIADLVGQGFDASLLRPQIIGAFRMYSNRIKQEITPVTQLSDDWLKQAQLANTPEDQMAQRALLEQTQNTIASDVDSYAEEIMAVVVLGGAAGATTSSLTNQVRGRISGVLMDSDDPEVRRQQRKYQVLLRKGATAEELASVVGKIKRRLPTEVNTAGSLRDSSIKSVEAGVMNYEGAFAAGASTRAGIEKWIYGGGIIGTSRDFCKSHVGNTYTKEQIQSIWTDSWAGKSPGDPMVVRGGYNCLHYWIPVQEEEPA